MSLKERARQRSPGRPSVIKDPVEMNLRLERDMRDAVAIAAEDRSVSRQELVRRVLHDWLTTGPEVGA